MGQRGVRLCSRGLGRQGLRGRYCCYYLHFATLHSALQAINKYNPINIIMTATAAIYTVRACVHTSKSRTPIRSSTNDGSY